MSRIVFLKNDGEKRVHEADAALLACLSEEEGEEGGQIGVSLDFDVRTGRDLIGLVGQLLAHLDDVFGEAMVTACLSFYATTAGKQMFCDGADGPTVTILRGARGGGEAT